MASSMYPRLADTFRPPGDMFPFTKWTDVEIMMQGTLTKLQNLNTTTMTLLEARSLAMSPRSDSIVKNFIDLAGCVPENGPTNGWFIRGIPMEKMDDDWG